MIEKNRKRDIAYIINIQNNCLPLRKRNKFTKNQYFPISGLLNFYFKYAFVSTIKLEQTDYLKSRARIDSKISFQM